LQGCDGNAVGTAHKRQSAPVAQNRIDGKLRVAVQKKTGKAGGCTFEPDGSGPAQVVGRMGQAQVEAVVRYIDGVIAGVGHPRPWIV